MDGADVTAGKDAEAIARNRAASKDAVAALAVSEIERRGDTEARATVTITGDEDRHLRSHRALFQSRFSPPGGGTCYPVTERDETVTIARIAV